MGNHSLCKHYIKKLLKRENIDCKKRKVSLVEKADVNEKCNMTYKNCNMKGNEPLKLQYVLTFLTVDNIIFSSPYNNKIYKERR